MIRIITILVLGWLLGVATDRLFPGSLPRTPAIVQSAVTSLGIKSTASVAVPNYNPTGRLSASIKAEIDKNYDEALRELRTYEQSGGDAFTASERAGWLYYLKGAYPQAEQAYLEANRLHPTAMNPVLGLLNVAQAMKDENRIHTAAEALLRIEPSNYRANMLLGGKDFATHNYSGAAFIYRKVLNIYPDDVDARSGLAWGEYYTGDTHDALVQFQTILNTYPDYPFAKQGYSLLARLNGAAASLR
jgi:tetratricopeptide (TPR) repeat protein